jgi:hypothetical protein
MILGAPVLQFADSRLYLDTIACNLFLILISMNSFSL